MMNLKFSSCNFMTKNIHFCFSAIILTSSSNWIEGENICIVFSLTVTVPWSSSLEGRNPRVRAIWETGIWVRILGNSPVFPTTNFIKSLSSFSPQPFPWFVHFICAVAIGPVNWHTGLTSNNNNNYSKHFYSIVVAW